MKDIYLFSAAALASGWFVFFLAALCRGVGWASSLGLLALISLVVQATLFLAGSQDHAFTVLLVESALLLVSTLILVGRDSDGE